MVGLMDYDEIKRRIENSAGASGCFVVNCASCRRRLGSVSRDGWVWTRGPGRIVNRRRLIATKPCDASTEIEDFSVKNASPSDDFRLRTVERARLDHEYRIWEYPYTCDSDECMNALGPEWTGRTGGRSTETTHKLMPAGKLLS